VFFSLRAAVAGITFALAAPVWAQLDIDREVESKRRVVLTVGQSKVISMNGDVSRVSIPDKAPYEAIAITSKQIVITGNVAGKSQLTLFDKSDRPSLIVVEVVSDFGGLESSLTSLYPTEKIGVAVDGARVVLSGEVSDARFVDEIEQVAKLYTEQVVNLLRPAGGQQVQLEVRFAEVSTTALKEMGFSLFGSDANGGLLGGLFSSRVGLGSFVGPAPANSSPGIPGTNAGAPGAGQAPPVVPSGGFVGAFHLFAATNRLPLSATLDVLAEEGLSKTLAEPNLVALSGTKAKFLAGGEFPIPTGLNNGQVSFDFKQFGIVMEFEPVVLGNGAMQLKIGTEVSDVDNTIGVSVGGVVVPGVTARRSETTVRMREGESFAIAGLISDRVRSVIDKVPLLGDIPVLGALFRSTSFRRDQTELLVVITPHLVEALPAMPELPGEKLRESPSNLELFLLGRSLKYTDSNPWGTKPGAPETGASSQPLSQAEPSGRFGFAP
jgi:pilus assembly protein CpaC